MIKYLVAFGIVIFCVALVDWVDTAMKGGHPLVIPVDIICGGGSQILAVTVEKCIKENKSVANAPKSM